VLSVAGILVGGLAVVRLGRTRSLLLGSALVIISNVSFSIWRRTVSRAWPDLRR
jgi:hypothetical protein